MSTTKFAFTKRAIEALQPPTKADRTYVYDSGQANLALCLTSAGTRTFYRYGRIDGRPVRLKLGTYPELSVENARKMVREASGDIARGGDPHAKRIAKRHEQNLQGLFDYWLVDHAKTKKKTWQADEWQFNKYLTLWRLKKLSTI